MLGLRVTRALEHPSDKPEIFTDAAGRPTTVASTRQHRRDWRYLTSEGKTGTPRGARAAAGACCRERVGAEPVAIAILDHPQNPGHPTYWHARGYGLFAANPLGPEGSQRREGRAELRARAATVRHVPLPHHRRDRQTISRRRGVRVEGVVVAGY